MNLFLFIGRVGKEIELKKLPNGTSTIDFSLAETEKYKGGEITTWVNCKAYGGQAETIAKYVRKGDVFHVRGKYRSDKYTAKDGSTRYANYLKVDEFELLPNRRDEKDIQTVDDFHEPQTIDDLVKDEDWF